MTRIIEALSEISDGYDAILCDLWGCYHDGVRPHAPAVAACRAFRARGGTVLLFTNAPRPQASVKAFLDKIGGPEDSYDGIVSSGAACRAALRAGTYGSAIYYLGPERDLHMLTDLGLAPAAVEGAEAVLCTGLVDDASETPEDYAPLLRGLAARGLPFLCANPDIIVDRGAQRLWCAGALARDYAALGGPVTYFGKPHRPVYDRAMEVIAETTGKPANPARVLAIGDGIHTDVKGGLDYGLDTLFVSGGLAAGEVGDTPDAPDPERLAAYLAAHDKAPQYTIGRLR